MVVSKRKPGVKITNDTPEHTYERNRQRYYLHLKKGKISENEYNDLMDKNLEDLNLSKKNQSLKDF